MSCVYAEVNKTKRQPVIFSEGEYFLLLMVVGWLYDTGVLV